MANTFNTRIQLKRDSLTNWNESTVVLKPGEVGVAYVDVATKDTHGNIIHVPTALLKVGENVEGSTKTFKDLPFVSALAADVYAWAKKEGIEVIDEGEGEVISDVAWDAENNALVLSRIDVVTPAELTEALKAYYTKTEIDNLLNNYYTKTEIDGITGDLTALNTTNKNNLVVAINEALQAVEVGGTGSVVTVEKLATPTEGSDATYVVKQGGNAVGDKIEIPTHADYLKTADKTELQGNIDAVSAVANAAQTAEQVGAAIDAKITELALGDTYDVKGAAATAEANAKGYTDAQIQAIMGGEVDEAYNSFLEIQNFLKADETATAALVETVNANTAAAAAAQATADAALPTATAEADYVKKADAVGYTDILTKTKAGTTYEPIGAQGKAEATAKGYTDAEIAKLVDVYDAKGAADTAKTEAIAAAKTETETQITALNIGQYAKTADLHAVATSGNVADLVQTEGTYLVLDGGTSTSVI